MGKTMTEEFKGYSKYPDEEYKEIWKNGLIVIDTNILLNFYRYSSETRNELYKTLKAVRNRLWIPYQVAYEYFKNKKKVITDTYKSFDDLLNETENHFAKLKSAIENTATKQLKCKDEVLEKLSKYCDEIYKTIKDEKESKKENASEEIVEKLIYELFNGSIGDEITGDEYEEMKKEGVNRIQNKIPPGYMDSDKEENGDYYIFYSMIKYAQENKKDIIFVTDDTKEDWFIKILGEKKGGDYRLLNEFYKKTGRLMLIYTSDGFLRAYQENINKEQIVNEEVLKELINTRKAENRTEKILNNRYSNEELAIELRNILKHTSIKDESILYVLERNYKRDDIDSNLQEILELLYLAYQQNNENLKQEVLIKIEKYLNYNYNRNLQYKINIRRIIEDIELSIEYNKELSFEKLCNVLSDELYVLSDFLKKGEKKQLILIKARIEELQEELQKVKKSKIKNEELIRKYLILEVKETLNFIKEKIKYI